MPPRFVLASRSPRRRQILELAGWPFDVQESQADETIAPGTPPDEAVQLLARRKVEAVAPSVPDAYVLGADTIVVCDGRLLGKPRTEEEAFAMLRLLSGRTHDVWTGVAIALPHQSHRLRKKQPSRFGSWETRKSPPILRPGSRWTRRGRMASKAAPPCLSNGSKATI